MAKKSRGRKGSGLKVDLSGVEVGGKTLPEGEYQVAVEEASLETSTNSGSQYIKFEFEVSEGDNKGYKLYHNCSLQPQALFNLKSVLAALGFEIPDKAFDLDLNELIGLECGVEVAHELYEGKKKSKIVEFTNLEDEEEDDDDDDDDEDEDEDDIDELLEDLDLKELKQLAKALKISAKELKKAKTVEELIELISEEDEDDIAEEYEELFGDDEDDEDDDDEDDDMDYEEMTLKDLKAECKDRGIKVKKGMKKEGIVELLEEDDED